jgi:hypothetical protein
MSLTNKDPKSSVQSWKKIPVRDDYAGGKFAKVIVDALHRLLPQTRHDCDATNLRWPLSRCPYDRW